MTREKNLGFETRAIHVGKEKKKCENCESTDGGKDPDTSKHVLKCQKKGSIDSTYKERLEKSLASLEEAQYAITYPSGLAAITAVTHLIKSGDHVVCSADCYGGTYGIFKDITSRMGINSTYVNITKLENIAEAIQENTKIIWAETVSNPLLYVLDVSAVAEMIKGKDILLVVDNTFLTPYFYRPLEFGAHIVVHSATKYLNGHSDVTMGTVATNETYIYSQLKTLQECTQNKPSPFDCSLVHDSLKTLSVRMRQHMENALEIAMFLEKHPAIEKVLHPLLPSHPQYQLAMKQHAAGYGGMVSFFIKGGLEEGETFLKSLKVITFCESLGGVESIIKLPYLMMPLTVSRERRLELGLTPNLIRYSVGIESVQDLIYDLDQGLHAALSVKSIDINKT